MTNINIKRKLYVVSFIIFIYILILSVGYAFFSQALTIDGIASTVEYYEGEKLPVSAVIRDNVSNRYYTASDEKKFVEFSSETWEDDTYTLNFDKKFGITAGSKTITYIITFTNPTTLVFNDGNIKTEIVDNNNSRIKEVTGSLSKSEIKQGESADVLFTIKFDFLTELGKHSAKATISYTYQNKPRYLYFIINYF